METVRDAMMWRDIVNNTPEEREAYNRLSVNDYLDAAKQYFAELMEGVDPEDPDALAQVLMDLNQLMTDFQNDFGEIGEVRVQGNGYYLPENGYEFYFLNGTQGISGEFGSFYISDLPNYAELLADENEEPRMEPTLCLELKNYRVYTPNDIALEPDEDRGSAIVPIEAQDLAYTRVTSEE